MEGDKRQERRHFLARHGRPSRLQRCGNAASGWWAGRVQDQPRALSPRTTPRTARQPSFGLLAAAGQSAASVPNIVGGGFIAGSEASRRQSLELETYTAQRLGVWSGSRLASIQTSN